MSDMTASASGAHAHDHGHAHDDHHHADLSQENTSAPSGWGRTFGLAMIGLGGLGCLATLAYPFVAGGEGDAAAKAQKHAAASYHVGVMVALGLALGPMALVLIFNLVKAGWSVTLRRQLENMASLVWLPVLLLIPTIVVGAIKPGILFKWMTPGLAEQDALLEHKLPFLNPVFFYIRLAVYALVWIYLGTRLLRYSREQDITGDKWITNKAGRTSAWGILVYALAVSFASFDLIKALDFHWFSTMFGVYFFAGNMVAGLSLLVLTLICIRRSGRLIGLVTDEHLHDLGKLCFAFTVFWAYIAFSQYFLIWYANIPEETAWVLLRGGGKITNEWTIVFWILLVGHFIVPFLFLLWRANKRSFTTLGIAASLLLVMHCLDMFWVIRPGVYALVPVKGEIIPGKLGFSWVDITGLIGPVCLFLGFLAWKVGSNPLIPLRDPRLPEALHHKNYV